MNTSTMSSASEEKLTYINFNTLKHPTISQSKEQQWNHVLGRPVPIHKKYEPPKNPENKKPISYSKNRRTFENSNIPFYPPSYFVRTRITISDSLSKNHLISSPTPTESKPALNNTSNISNKISNNNNNITSNANNASNSNNSTNNISSNTNNITNNNTGTNTNNSNNKVMSNQNIKPTINSGFNNFINMINQYKARHLMNPVKQVYQPKQINPVRPKNNTNFLNQAMNMNFEYDDPYTTNYYNSDTQHQMIQSLLNTQKNNQMKNPINEGYMINNNSNYNYNTQNIQNQGNINNSQIVNNAENVANPNIIQNMQNTQQNIISQNSMAKSNQNIINLKQSLNPNQNIQNITSTFNQNLTPNQNDPNNLLNNPTIKSISYQIYPSQKNLVNQNNQNNQKQYPPQKSSLSSNESISSIKTSGSSNLDLLKSSNSSSNITQAPLSCGDYSYYQLHKIGIGTYSNVYCGTHKDSNYRVAIKVPNKKAKSSSIEQEILYTKYLMKEPGFPLIYNTYNDNGKYIMVETLLGPSLDKFFIYCNRQFPLKTIYNIGIQMTQRLESMHKKGVLHRDLKPNNLSWGNFTQDNNSNPSTNIIKTVDDLSTLYLIDFGLSLPYMDVKTGKIFPNIKGLDFEGTLRYSSINAHKGFRLSPKDDLESMMYILIYFYKGRLPWQDIQAKDDKEKILKIKDAKLRIPISFLCDGMPKEFEKLLTYIKSLNYEDIPDYSLIINTFKLILEAGKIVGDYNWEGNFNYIWEKKMFDDLVKYEKEDNEIKKKIINENLENIFRGYPTELIKNIKDLILTLGNKGKASIKRKEIVNKIF